MDAGQTLRAARKRSGMSLRALGQHAGTSHATLSAYESGAKVPRVDTLDRLLRAAGFSSELDLGGRADSGSEHRVAKGRELADVLELAEQFPARHAPELPYPRFAARR